MTLQIVVSLTLVLGLYAQARADNCLSLSKDKQSALVDYVRKQYKIDESANLKLDKVDPVEGSCYRALTFEGKSVMKTWQLTLYLSPDQRFLTGELFDVSLDPVKEEERKAQLVMAGLLPNKGSSRGQDNAPVTIVEFSDFECPFCRRFEELTEQLSPTENDQIRIVFHHLPLPNHQWARVAAEGAACAQVQGRSAFWAMHDQLFHHQQEITSVNIKSKLTEYAQNSKDIDIRLFQACMDNEMSLGLVFRDISLASTNNIHGTPTLFINGHRIEGIKDIAELRQLIAEAKKSSPLQTKGGSSGASSNQ